MRTARRDAATNPRGDGHGDGNARLAQEDDTRDDEPVAGDREQARVVDRDSGACVIHASAYQRGGVDSVRTTWWIIEPNVGSWMMRADATSSCQNDAESAAGGAGARWRARVPPP